MWRTVVRDILQPLTGLTFLGHEVFFESTPRNWVLGIGMLLVGGPVAAAVDRLWGQSSSTDTPPK